MKYIQLVAKPDTWFESGTEVLWEDNKFQIRRPTLSEWEQIKKDGSAVFRGWHRNLNILSDIDIYDKLFQDGELCHIDEFEAEIVEEDKLDLDDYL